MDCMVDTETLDIKTLPQVLSIGAVLFDPLADAPTETMFYNAVYPETCAKLGGTMGLNTLLWWSEPDKAGARKFAMGDDAGRCDIQTALNKFAFWCRAHNVETIWSHGLTYDAAFLMRYAELCNVDWPVTSYKGANDTRTLFRLIAREVLGDPGPAPNGWPKHHPTADAWWQAAMVQRCFKFLNPKGGSKGTIWERLGKAEEKATEENFANEHIRKLANLSRLS